jgi:diguanylate cyclase (GGDEF)-like protein
MSRPSDILILCRDPQFVRRCTQALTDPDLRVWTSASEVPDGVSLQVIVTDQLVPGDDLPHTASASRLAAGEIGVLRLAGGGGADVCLAADFTSRELGLACRLLAQVVRLRQERSQARRQTRILRHLAYTDPLTGLPNRRAWDERLAAPTATTCNEPAAWCLALLDLDHFKEVNDRWGYAVGDEVLRHVGQRLAALTPDTGFVARLGGDEFGLLIARCEDSAPAVVVESLRTAACEGSPHTTVTASAGGAITDALRPSSWDALLHAASDSLRQAKSSGRQQTCVRTCLP